MKRVLLSCAGLLLAMSFVMAQPDGSKLAKQAGKSLAAYYTNPKENAEKLDEAKMKIDEAMTTDEAKGMASAWVTRGEVYSTILQRDMAKRMVDPNATLSGDNDALVAFEAYKNAYENPEAKKYEKSDAVKGIIEVQAHLINIGVAKFEKGEYAKAYNSFKSSIDAHDILTANDQKSVLETPEQYENQLYVTGLAAQQANLNKEALKYYDQLYKTGKAKPGVYEGIYGALMSLGEEDKANVILNEGRAKHPDDSGLLFAEINLYLKSGKLKELTDRLKQAIEKEPNNIGLYVTLGNVYDNLYQQAIKDKDDAKATEYFTEAKKYYTQATEKDPKNVDAVYSLGALYYNKAAVKTQEMNALPDDFSSAGLKKLKEMKDEVMGLFDQALPYFQKAESLDPNDLNTLIALNEIYARKEDELSTEFKKRLDNVRDGGKNETSHFKN